MTISEHRDLEVGPEFLADFAQRYVEARGEVVLVMLRPQGRVLLHTKSFYPKGVYRLLSGKMHANEHPEQAAWREIGEETGLHPETVTGLGRITYTLRSGDWLAHLETHIFVCSETTEIPHPMDTGESITEFREVPVCDLQNVAEQLRHLGGRWSDWGRFRAIAHEAVYRELCG